MKIGREAGESLEPAIQTARQQPSEARCRDEVDDELQPTISLCLSSTLLTLRSLSLGEGGIGRWREAEPFLHEIQWPALHFAVGAPTYSPRTPMSISWIPPRNRTATNSVAHPGVHVLVTKRTAKP